MENNETENSWLSDWLNNQIDIEFRKNVWNDEARLEMIEKSAHYSQDTVYQYGYYDGYLKGFRKALQHIDNKNKNLNHGKEKI